MWDTVWWDDFYDVEWGIRGLPDKTPPWSEFYSLAATKAKLPYIVSRDSDVHHCSSIISECMMKVHNQSTLNPLWLI